MTKEDFIKLGIDEALALKCETASQEELKAFIPKAKFDEASEENKTLKQSVVDRDKQLDDLKKSSGDNVELKKQIEALQQQNADQKKAHDAEMAQLRLDNAIDSALTAAGAKNIKAVKPFIDVTKVKLGDDGKLTGFDEQVKEVQKTEGYLFAEKQTPQFRGFQPGASMDGVPGTSPLTPEQFRKLSPEERHAYSLEHSEEYRKLYEGGK